MPSNINQELAHIFEEMGLIYQVENDRFRSRALLNVANTIDHLSEDIKDIYDKGGLKKLEELNGVGRGSAEKIEEYIKTGKVKEYEQLKKKVPINLSKLTSVEGVGAKMAKTLYEELGIKNLKELEKAAKQGKIEALEGFGKKTQQNILQGIAFAKESSQRRQIGEVLPYARKLVEEIKEIQGVKKAEFAGSLRRKQETIGDVDILVTAKDNQKVLDYVANLPSVVKVWGEGKTKVSVHLRQGIDIDIRAVEAESYGSALQYFTGSKEHNVKLRQLAIENGYKLNEYGLFKNEKNYASGEDECKIYEKLSLACPPPELRTDTGEIEAAKNNKLPKLIEYDSLRGDLQIQTSWTDGKNTIEEYARAAKEMGHEYIAITDHTKTLAMTGGLDEKKLLKHQQEVRKIDEKISGIKVLSGAEVNILKDGFLDIDNETLSQLDVVGISVHSNFNLSRKEQTKRIIRAMENPNAHILFHPTGRRINKRPPYDVDMEEIIKAAKETGTILEINAHPERLDLKDSHIRMAVETGVKMCINTDAHSVDGLNYLEYGIAQARRGWAKESDIINTLPVEGFLKALK